MSRPALRQFFIPLVVLLMGLSVTTAAALMAQSSAVREQELLFDAAVDNEVRNFETELATEIDEFHDAVDFVAATFPPSPREFNSFFESSERFAAAESDGLGVGLGLIEPVELSGVGALEAREALLGQPGFRVTSNAGGAETRYVLTRVLTSSATELPAFVGTDIRPFISEELLTSLLEEESSAFPLDEAGVLTSSLARTSEIFGLPRALLVERIEDDGTGQNLAWLVQLFNVDGALESVMLESQGLINSRVTSLGDSALVIDVDTATESSPENTTLNRSVFVEESSIEWTLTFWADEGFAVQTGLFAQNTIWIVGLVSTLLGFAASVFWVVNRKRLDTASFELSHARTLASTDALTGLLNRKGFVEAVNDQNLTGGGVVIFIDLDGFKDVNDTLGHSEGDRVLRDVAEIIRKQFRVNDIVSRFGGDEFMVYAPKHDSNFNGHDAGCRVVEAIANADLGVTCSVGSAERPAFDLTPVETLIRYADRAMYLAKEAGGNRLERSVKHSQG